MLRKIALAGALVTSLIMPSEVLAWGHGGGFGGGHMGGGFGGGFGGGHMGGGFGGGFGGGHMLGGFGGGFSRGGWSG